MSVPTAHRARTVAYAPDLDGQADPGEIVWTWVVFEEDPSRGKDRPVLVVGRDRQTLLGLMLGVTGLLTKSDTEMYARSLGININLIWGAVLFVFGVLMLIAALRARKR